jgi:hypothetical protein
MGPSECINKAFRKEMTSADANFVARITQRNFGPQTCPSSRQDCLSRKANLSSLPGVFIHKIS